MSQRIAIGLSVLALCSACGAKPTKFDWSGYQPPEWRMYQAQDVGNGKPAAPTVQRLTDRGRVTLRDLKTETDESLAQRLLGAVGERIAYIDRHRDRWRYYGGDNDAAESVGLYTRPDALGSQYGLCGVEKFSVSFDNSGHISAVAVDERYGIEGPIFQKGSFDWDLYYKVICASAPVTHAPSYFPAPDSFVARDVAMLLVPAIDLAASSQPLPYRLACRDTDNHSCRDDVRRYLGALRLKDIDKFSLANCPLPGGPKAVCFTIETGNGRLGSFPKSITVKGSNYMNNVRVDSVDVNEGFTIS